MKYSTALIVASAVAVSATCTEETGNFFCELVSHIKYNGLDIPGSYQAVSSMDKNGNCQFVEKPYSGPIAPFDEELSLHFRGPLKLNQVAVYRPSTTKKRDTSKPHSKRHGHQHLHKKHMEEAKRGVVTAVIDGQTQTWENNWFGYPTTTPAAAPTTKAEAPASKPTILKSGKTSGSSSSSTSSSGDSSSSVPAGDFERTAYYNAQSQVADGLVFMGNYGGQGSGVFDTTWGSSLAYLNEEGTGGCASPAVLKSVLVGDNQEFSIWSDKECGENDADCGYFRPGTVAHHGFGGADKVFLFDFQMPVSGKTGFNADMSAMWFLNSRIPRTQQYGACSCWGGVGKTGCGEADIFEVLASGDTKCKSTFHYTNSIGSSDYFDRPIDSPVKVAVIFQASSSTASIKVLPPGTDFSTSLTAKQVGDMVDKVNDLGLFSMMTIPSS